MVQHLHGLESNLVFPKVLQLVLSCSLSIYVNNVGNNIFSTQRLFADDCLLYRVVNSIEDVYSYLLQLDFNFIANWCLCWQMRLNINRDKCYLQPIINYWGPHIGESRSNIYIWVWWCLIEQCLLLPLLMLSLKH